MLRCSDGSLYVGIATDLEERVKELNWGVGAAHTEKRRPVMLVWNEEFPNRAAARKREVELKGWGRRKKLALIAEANRIHPSLRSG